MKIFKNRNDAYFKQKLFLLYNYQNQQLFGVAMAQRNT